MAVATSEELLRKIASTGEIEGHELVRLVPRAKEDYTDFYGLAALIQSGYIAANTEAGVPFGQSMRECAALLCQLSLKPGESFPYGEIQWNTWDAGPIMFFLTGSGVIKLEELDSKASAKRQKRNDYIVSAVVAVLAAALSSTATHMYSQYRDSLSRSPACAPKPQSSPNNSFKPKPIRGSA